MKSLEETVKKAESQMQTTYQALKLRELRIREGFKGYGQFSFDPVKNDFVFTGPDETLDPEPKTKFKIGQKVKKVGGRYGGPGRIVGITEELDDSGYFLYTVAMKVEGGYGEFVHVFPESVLEAAE